MSTQLKIFLLGMMIASSMAFTLRTKGGQHDAYTQKTTKTTTNECVCEEVLYVCGESEAVHSAWNDARADVWRNGGTAEDVMTNPMAAARKAGANDETMFCVGFVSGVTTGWYTCKIIDWLVEKGCQMGYSKEQVKGWIEAAAKKRYPWYAGYDTECKYFYEQMEKQKQEEEKRKKEEEERKRREEEKCREEEERKAKEEKEKKAREEEEKKAREEKEKKAKEEEQRKAKEEEERKRREEEERKKREEEERKKREEEERKKKEEEERKKKEEQECKEKEEQERKKKEEEERTKKEEEAKKKKNDCGHTHKDECDCEDDKNTKKSNKKKSY